MKNKPAYDKFLRQVLEAIIVFDQSEEHEPFHHIRLKCDSDPCLRCQIVKALPEDFQHEVLVSRLPNAHLPSIKESFQDGYQTGITWPAKWNHRPGGPSIYSGYDRSLVEFSWKSRQEWMKGFDSGILKNPNITSGHPAKK